MGKAQGAERRHTVQSVHFLILNFCRIQLCQDKLEMAQQKTEIPPPLSQLSTASFAGESHPFARKTEQSNTTFISILDDQPYVIPVINTNLNLRQYKYMHYGFGLSFEINSKNHYQSIL